MVENKINGIFGNLKSHCEGDEPPVGPPASWLVEGRYAKKTFRSGRKTRFYFLSALLAVLIHYPRYRHAHLRKFGWFNICTSK
jgi:hypothetical protein